MSDYISRQDAIDAVHYYIESGYKCDIFQELKDLPSAEPERKSKVIEHDASITDTDGYKYLRTEYICGACKKKVIGGDDYCSHCGARLEWNELRKSN